MNYLKSKYLDEYLKRIYPKYKFEYDTYEKYEAYPSIYWFICEERHFAYCYQEYNWQKGYNHIEIIVFDKFDYDMKPIEIKASQIMRELKLNNLT